MLSVCCILCIVFFFFSVLFGLICDKTATDRSGHLRSQNEYWHKQSNIYINTRICIEIYTKTIIHYVFFVAPSEFSHFTTLTHTHTQSSGQACFVAISTMTLFILKIIIALYAFVFSKVSISTWLEIVRSREQRRTFAHTQRYAHSQWEFVYLLE